MAALTDLVTRLRLELGDPASPFQARVVADGETDVFSLPYELLDATTVEVYANGALLTESTDYTVDYRSGILTMSNPPADGVEVVVQGNQFMTFLGEDLETFINTAFLQHSHGQTVNGLPQTMATLPPVEEYLVVLLAEIEALWVLITDAAQEIDVRNPDGVSIPVGQRYQQLLGLLAAKRAQYEELASALNVGLHRIEMLNLRRTSRTTNRLVPLYKAMEYDERPKGFWPDYGPAGTVVTVKGDHLTGTTGVSLGGVATEFEVINDEHIQFTVPAGLANGLHHIVITTPGGVGTSQYGFTVGSKIPQIAFGAAMQRIRPPIDDGVV